MKLQNLLLCLVVFSFGSIGAMNKRTRSSSRKKAPEDAGQRTPKKKKRNLVQLRPQVTRSVRSDKELLGARLVAYCKRSLDPAIALLKDGASADARDQSGSSLHYACFCGDLGLVKLLLAANANKEAHTQDGATPLHVAAWYGHKEVVEVLVNKGASKEAQTRQGATPLRVAAWNGHKEVVEVLVEKGANIEAQTQAGATPLCGAAWNGHKEVVEVLANKGANIEAQTQAGATPLHGAAWNGHKEVVEVLANKGANKEAHTQDGATPLCVAAWNGHKEVVEVLVEKGANIEVQLNNDATYKSESTGGFTPLHVAVFFGKQDVVNVLLKHDADITAVTSDGRTVVDIARQKGHDEFALSLENYIKAKELQNGQSLDALAAIAMDIEAPDILVEIEQGRPERIRRLIDVHTYTAEELKNAFNRALELKRKDIVGLLISMGAVPLQNVGYAAESPQKKVKVRE